MINRRSFLTTMLALTASVTVPKLGEIGRVVPRQEFLQRAETALHDTLHDTLFEHNTPELRSSIAKSLQAALTDFGNRMCIVCDDTNNDDRIVDSNSFVIDVYYKDAVGTVCVNGYVQPHSANFSEKTKFVS